jgi:hypothetical protein
MRHVSAVPPATATTLVAARAEELPARLALLFDAMRDRQRSEIGVGLPQRLELLFANLQPLATRVSPPTLKKPVDAQRLRALLARLAPQLEAARLDGKLTDVWTIARIGRNEVRNTAVLAGLWNPLLCGTVATASLTTFLARLPAGGGIPTADELSAGYTIRTEDRPLDRADERVDIVIEGATFLLGIEIKIDAPEGFGQLAAYRHALEARAAEQRKRPALLFLSPRPPLDGITPHARWSNVAAVARRLVPQRESERTFVHQLLAHFATHIADF